MTSPLPDSELVVSDTQIPSRGPFSVGAGAAITGVFAVGALLIGFLLILNYTDLLVGNSAHRVANANNPNAFVGEMFILAVTFSPMVLVHMLCAKIIDKA